MVKLTKIFVRIWITATSLAAFGIGWAILAHSPKPAPLVAVQPASVPLSPTQLPPIPSLQQLQLGGPLVSSTLSGNLSLAPSGNFSPPRLRTMGS